jgi:ABC-2 type transport system ATP-binding protein
MLKVQDVTKTYDGRSVVNRVSFEVQPGEIFALLGPNGAGKTTLIRMITDIIRPDSGSVTLNGQAVGGELKNLIAYLPEERGVYKRVKLVDAIAYFGELKGMTGRAAREAAVGLLAKVELSAHADKQVMMLSKGMQQKVQLCTALIGEPQLLILDEPFTGLDPINVQLFENILEERSRAGATIILSTHQMNKVEELCDRALMINRGHMVLYGAVSDIRRQYGGHAVMVTGGPVPSGIPGVRESSATDAGTRLVLEPSATAQQVLRALLERGVAVESYAPDSPPLEDVFVRVVNEGLGLDQGKSGPPTMEAMHPLGGAR